jgi:hypothetical protein
VRRLSFLMTAVAAIGLLAFPALAELGTDTPPNDDDTLLTQREMEAGCDTSTMPPLCPSSGSGIFDIPLPGPNQRYQPARRVPRDKFGVVSSFMPDGLKLQDLDALVYPGTSPDDKAKLLEGMVFFTMFHSASEGLGPVNNQPACIGCHLNSAEAVKSKGLLGPNCPGGSPCASNVTRAARSTLTNFGFTSLDPATGGGRAPDNLDAINNTGKTAAFTTFGDFSKMLLDTAPGSVGFFDPLDGLSHSSTTSSFTSQPFGGFVQHVRPPLPDICAPKPLPPLLADTNLTNGSNSGDNPNGFRRSVGERAGPPYIGRGLMEAVPTADIQYFAVQNGINPDPQRANGFGKKPSSLGIFANQLGCTGGYCISGKANMIPRNFTVHTATTDPQNGTDTGFVGGVGRFGLRANGVEILQFAVGGLQGELSFTSLFNGAEINLPLLFPGGTTTGVAESLDCAKMLSETFGQAPSALRPPLTPGSVDLAKLEVHLSEPFSERNFIRNTAPPEFGDALLDVLQSDDPAKPWRGDRKRDHDAAVVQRGAELFGIDLVAFANRTVGHAMKAGGDNRDDNAINQSDRKLNCVGCHTPIRKTGLSPTALTSSGVGSYNLSYKWAPIFSDQLLHHMPVIDAERETTNGLPRDVVVISRLAMDDGDKNDFKGKDDSRKGERRIFDTLDLPRNLADDSFSNLKATAEGPEFRTAPLTGIGRIGPPFLHDARVYLSKDTVGKTPAGTVTTNRELTNAPLVVRSLDDAILAAIELHDLPAPDDKNTPKTTGAGCPVPRETTNVDYVPSPTDVICPAYDSGPSQTNRSDAREVIRRFRGLSSGDQQAVIEFLKQL